MKHTVRNLAYFILPMTLGFLGSCSQKKSSRPGGAAPTAGQNQTQDEIDADAEGEAADTSTANANENPVAEGAPTNPANPANPEGPKNPEMMPEAPPSAPAPKVFSLMGVRNFESINSTMSALTGVPKTTPTIVTAFNANKVALPTHSFAENLSSSAVVGLFKLAATYCDELAKSVTLRPAVYGTFNFAGLPQAVLTPDGMRQVADALVTKFWGKDLARLPPHDANVTQMVTTMTELKTLIPGNTAADTVKIINGSCTAALMSTGSVVY